MCELKNTVKFTFNNDAEKPTIGEVVAFVLALDVDRGEIDTAYRMAEEKALFIKFKSEAAMLHALTANSDELMFHYANEKIANVHMSHAQETIYYVRIHDLPPEVPDQDLTLVLGKYGKVKRVVREKFPIELGLDAYTGVRGVYMDVKKEIPTALHFQNRKGHIFYPGNKEKCFLCKQDGHRINSCPKRKIRNQMQKGEQQQQQIRSPLGSSTYADAVSGGTMAVNPGTSNSQKETTKKHDEVQETAMGPAVAEISDYEDMSEDDIVTNNPLYKFGQQLCKEVKKRKELLKDAEEQQQAKIQSPPRKKKNFSLYQK